MFDIVYLDIVSHCNARCPYCHSGSNRIYGSKREIRPDDFRSILERLREDGALSCKSPLHLYCWGEPFLHSNLGALTAILNECGQKFAFSTNATIIPAIDADFTRNLDSLAFSLSGFSEESYGRIHGLRFERVKSNIEIICAQIRESNDSCRLSMYMHVYKHNKSELAAARRFCSRNGIVFLPYRAILNHWHLAKTYFAGMIDKDTLLKIKADLALPSPDHIRSQQSNNYTCPQGRYLVIDEVGDVALCCQTARDEPGSLCGNILRESLAQIVEKRRKNPICNVCIQSGLSYYFNTSMGTYRLAIPSCRQFYLQSRKLQALRKWVAWLMRWQYRRRPSRNG